MWHLSSLTKYQTRASCMEAWSLNLTTGSPQKSPYVILNEGLDTFSCPHVTLGYQKSQHILPMCMVVP